MTVGERPAAAYALAKLAFRLPEVVLWAIIASQMGPGIVSLIPVFLIVKSMPLAGGNGLTGTGGHGWLNSYEGLIVPFTATAFHAFLLRQFFQSMPNELL